MNGEQAIRFIHSLYRKGAAPGLARIRQLTRLLGDPQNRLKFVHIAGTNGKGSTAAMTASILQQAGYRTGLFTSPYLYRFHERLQINGIQISDEALGEVTEYVASFLPQMEEPPTEFEFVCAVAFVYFVRENCRIVVLEAGMGGTFDPTNVISCPEAAVITNIGLDHTEILGDTPEKIARNKAGIFKPGGRAVVYGSTPSVEAVFTQVCRAQNCTLKIADFENLRSVSHSLQGQVFDCGSRKNLVLPLLGDHQLHNACVALCAVDTLIGRGWNISEQAVYEGLRRVSWQGRFDIVSRDPLFIIDGGHNPQCIEALVRNIQDYLADRRVIVLTGVLSDKDYADMYKPVMPFAEQFVCITPPNPRRLEGAALAEYLRRAGACATACETIDGGVRTALKLAGKDGVVLSFGSLYTIGAVRDALEQVLAESL